ncbi:hypothetical protein [Ruegeria lacuscaerulensis]|uniref:hypothetical protein n=1 Tax=Ruegeria lacuscaerulensis TaxID=55218 RepID=UPI00147C66C4|nr:hypothetical protein [Ruegeria lacuscaerulensis]
MRIDHSAAPGCKICHWIARSIPLDAGLVPYPDKTGNGSGIETFVAEQESEPVSDMARLRLLNFRRNPLDAPEESC